MAINRETGEIIGDLGTNYYVAPFSRWAETPLFAEAYYNAVDAFVSSGAILPVTIREDQVLVQEYPDKNKVAFLFQLRIKGKDHFYPYIYDLPGNMVASLRMTGRWGRPH